MANNLDVFAKAASVSRTKHDRKVAQGRSHARKDSVTLTVSMSERDRDAIRDGARELSIPVSVLVRLACREYLKSHDVEV